MPRKKERFSKDKKRQVVRGFFHGVHEGPIKNHPMRRDLCSFDELLYKRTKKGKKKRTEREQENYLTDLWGNKFKELEDEKRNKREKEEAIENTRSISIQIAMQKWLDEIQTYRSPKTHKDYVGSVNYYLDCIGDHPINDFKNPYKIDLKQFFVNKGFSEATQFKHIMNIQSFFNWAVENLDCKPIKLKKPRKVKKEPVIYSRSELGKIEQYLEKMLKDIQSKRSKKSKQNQLRAFKMAKETAMRGGEIWSLLLSNIRIAERKILLRVNTELDWNPKSKEEEWVPISKFLAAFLEEDLKTRAPEEQWFLDNGRGQNYYSSEEKLARPFTLMNRKLGILGPKPIHGIRASVITHLLEDGHPPQKVQKLARHKLLSTTMGYFNTENLAVHDLVDTISIAHESPTALGVSYKE